MASHNSRTSHIGSFAYSLSGSVYILCIYIYIYSLGCSRALYFLNPMAACFRGGVAAGTSSSPLGTQKTEHSLIEGYTLNHIIRDSNIFGEI